MTSDDAPFVDTTVAAPDFRKYKLYQDNFKELNNFMSKICYSQKVENAFAWANNVRTRCQELCQTNHDRPQFVKDECSDLCTSKQNELKALILGYGLAFEK